METCGFALETSLEESVYLPEVSRQIYADQFSSEELFTKIMNNEIVEDEFTKINKEEFTDEYGDTTVEIELDELKARTYENGAMVEHFEKQVMGTKAAGVASETEWYSDKFVLYLTVTYDRITAPGTDYGPMYKITKVTGKYDLLQGRYEFHEMTLYAGAYGKAATSPTNVIGSKTERKTWDINNPLDASTYTMLTGFQYYIDAVAILQNVGAYAELHYTFSNDPEWREFRLDIYLGE